MFCHTHTHTNTYTHEPASIDSDHVIKELTSNSITSVSQPKEMDERDKKTEDGCHCYHHLKRGGAKR